MKKQFTNGEWSTQTPPTIDNKNIRYIAADIGIIAEVRERNDIEISENVANAKLMAAAPKMFKTLEMVFSKLDYKNQDLKDKVWEVIEKHYQ